MRLRSIENIIEEIKLLNKKYGVTLFLPLDDLFTFDKKRIIALLKRIKELKIPGIEIQTPSALAVNILDEEVVDALIGAGLKIAILAIESGSKFVQQKIIKKFCNLEKAKWLVKLFKDRGVLVRAYFIFGFPHETKEQMQETVDYARSLQIDWCVFSIAAPLVGSEMYKEFVEMGSIEDNLNTWRETVFDHRGFDTPDISADELNDFAYRANLDCNFLNNPNKVKGNFKKAIKIYEDILSRIPYHIVAWYCIMECYLKLKKMKKAEEIKNRMKKLIQSDNRAKKMYLKYKDMMPKYSQI
jgi:pentatricopeptide repeat protein